MADTSVKVFRSTDSGAASLSNTAGALIGVLDACLVNGYGTVTVTPLVVAGGVATGTVSAGHGFTMLGSTGPVITIAGATPSGLNGVWRVASVPSSTTFTFAVSGISDQTATGTITAKRTPAGWSKAFSGTNKAVYQGGSGNRLPVRVSDPANTATVSLYESMTDIDNGVLVASDNLDKVYNSASNVAWHAIADDKGLVFGWQGYAPGSGRYGYLNWLIGDTEPFLAPDAYAAALSINPYTCTQLGLASSMRRARTPAGGAGALSGTLLSLLSGNVGVSGPTALLGGAEKLVLPIWLTDNNSLVTDRMRGLYRANQAKSVMGSHLSTLMIATGRECAVIDSYINSSPDAYIGKLLVDITGPW